MTRKKVFGFLMYLWVIIYFLILFLMTLIAGLTGVFGIETITTYAKIGLRILIILMILSW